MIYRTIVADPPWPFGDRISARGRGASNHYRLMTLGDILAYLPGSGIEIARDARLFLWRVAAMQDEALLVLKAWGFAPTKTEVVWVKTRANGALHFGMGRTVRASHETALIAARGRPARLSASVRSVFMAPYTRHSEKPDAFYELVESLSPGPYLDIFARRERPGWTCIGDALGC